MKLQKTLNKSNIKLNKNITSYCKNLEQVEVRALHSEYFWGFEIAIFEVCDATFYRLKTKLVF
jgi:hypothetical protein